MADNLILPVCLDRVLDSNGDPVSGAKVYVYDAGTTNEKNVYTDDDLTTAAANPIIADSGGYLVGRYIGTGAYKLVITDSADVTIKTEDNLPGALDTSSFASDEATPVTPVITKTAAYTVLSTDQGKVIAADPTGGGFTITLPSAVTVGDDWRITIKHTGTANAVTVSATGGQTIDGDTSFALNYQHEAITIVSDGADWQVSETARYHQQRLSVTPQGRLTLTSGTPVLAADVAPATTVYYTPYNGDLLPFYDGNRFIVEQFTELSLTLVSQHEADGIYDVFAFLDGTTQRIGTGPKWSNVSAGSGARGTGASTTELERAAGLWLNKESITLRNGTSTYSVSANRATYLGSILMDGTAGQVSCHVSYGQARKWGVWNAFNRKPIVMKAGDGTASWAYTTATYRAANGSSDNSLTVFAGLEEENITLDLLSVVKNTSEGTELRNGIGWNSTSAISGTPGLGSPTGLTADMTLGARYQAPPDLGKNVVTALEYSAAAGTSTWSGTESGLQLVAAYLG